MNEQQSSAESKFFIANAGLVLLVPFLPHFFRLTGVAIDGKFSSPAASAKAASMLQYVIGSVGEPLLQGDLALNKLLCGLPPAEPLPVEAPAFTPDERRKCEQEKERMLEAVIAHWKSPGRITPDSLTEAFLRRNGMLSLDGAVTLQVEKKPYDLLLNSLPWVLSIIQTPWMPGPIEVVWNE